MCCGQCSFETTARISIEVKERLSYDVAIISAKGENLDFSSRLSNAINQMAAFDKHRQIESNEKNQRLRKRESIIVGLMLRKMKDESVRKKEIPSNNFYKKINGYGKENRLFSELVSRKVKDEFVEEEHDRIISIKEDERLRKRESIDYSYITKNKR